MKKLLLSACAALPLFACSGGGGGGSPDAPADVQIAEVLSGTWQVTFTTGAQTNCPGQTVGATGSGTITITQTPGTASIRVDITEGGTDTYTGRVTDGAFEATSTLSDGTGVLTLAVVDGRLVGTDTFTFTAPPECVFESEILGTRISGGPSFTANELAGSYRFTANVTESNNPNVPVGTQEPMAILFEATSATSFDAKMLLGPFALGNLASVPGDVTTCTGDVQTVGLRITISRASASAPFTIVFETSDVANNEEVTATAQLVPQTNCLPVSGDWEFEFSGSGGGTITGPLQELLCSLCVDGSGANERMGGILDAGGTWEGGVAFGQATGAEAAFLGTFNGDQFSGVWDNGVVSGQKVTSAPGNCVNVATGTWNLELSFNGQPQLDFSGGVLSQNGCNITFDYNDTSGLGLDLDLVGEANGTSWTPTVAGPLFGSLTNFVLSFNPNGQSVNGTALFNGQLLVVTGSKQ